MGVALALINMDIYMYQHEVPREVETILQQ